MPVSILIAIVAALAVMLAPAAQAGAAVAATDRDESAETAVEQSAQPSGDSVEPQALPIIGLPVILACVGTVGLSAYQAYNGGDPVEYISSAILGCIPFGAAARPAVVGLIKSNPAAIANALRALGAGALASSLCGDTAGC